MARTPTLGNAIRFVRKARGVTQEGFSDVSSRTYLSSLERGLKSPTLGKIESLASALHVHPLTLLLVGYAGLARNEQRRLIDKVMKEIRELAQQSQE